MSRVPNLKERKLLSAIKKAGFFEVQSTQRGSHRHFSHPETGRTTSISLHGGEVPRNTLKKIIKQMGLTEEEFRGLL